MLQMEITGKNASVTGYIMDSAKSKGSKTPGTARLSVSTQDGKTATYQDDFDEIGFANLIDCL